MQNARYKGHPARSRRGGGFSFTASIAKWSSRTLLLILPIVGAMLAGATLYSSLFLRHRSFRHRANKWKPALPLPLDLEAHHHMGRPREPLAEWAVPTNLHRAAAAYCLASPTCKLAILFTDGSDDPREESDFTVRHPVSGPDDSPKAVPVIRMHSSDEYAVAAGPAIVTCPNPRREVWLTYGGARWNLEGAQSPDWLARCAATLARSAGGGEGHGPSDNNVEDSAAEPTEFKPRWVTCDWLQRLTKGDPIRRPSDCGFGAGSVAALARYVIPGSAQLALLKSTAADVLLYGPQPERGLARKAKIREAAVFKGVPQPGDGAQAMLTLLRIGEDDDDTAKGRRPPEQFEVLRLFTELRKNEAFTRPSPLLPVVSFEPCHEWPVTQSGGEAACGPRPFGPFDHLLALKNAILLAAWHKYRLIPPDMQRVHEESDGDGHASVADAVTKLPVARLVDLTSLSAGLRGTADVVDTSSFDPAGLGWSLKAVSLVGPEGHLVTESDGIDSGSSGSSGGGSSGLEMDMHAALKREWTVQKVHVNPCPLGAVTWQPRRAVHWHMPLRARMTAAMEPPARIAALRSAFQLELRRQSGKAGYNAIDLRDLHVNQERCRCMIRSGGRHGRLSEETLDCGLGPAEIAHVLKLTLGFDPSLPLFAAVDGVTSEEVLPELQRGFKTIVTLEDLFPWLVHGGGSSGADAGDDEKTGHTEGGGGLTSEEIQLLEGAIAEEAGSFAGQFLSPLSFHVKERRAHRTERGAAGASSTSAAAVSDGSGALAAAAAARGPGAALIGGSWLPRQSSYFDRSDPRSCAVTSSPGLFVRDSGSSASGGVHSGGAQGQYAEPCDDELRLWLR